MSITVRPADELESRLVRDMAAVEAEVARLREERGKLVKALADLMADCPADPDATERFMRAWWQAQDTLAEVQRA